MTPPFNWLTFLLGFAIALWVALVVLLLLPENEAPSQPVACVSCGGAHGARLPTRPQKRPLWIEAGSETYYCSNTDAGGGYVEDSGGGYVDDAGGGYVDDGGGGYVDDAGGGYVDDNAPRAPVPSRNHGKVDRGEKEYHCETNDSGGGYVEDSGGRSVTQPMLRLGSFLCWKDPAGNAVVVQSNTMTANTTYQRAKINRYQRAELYDYVQPNAANLVTVQASYAGLDRFVYCMVTKNHASAYILDREGTCASGNCP